MYIKAEFYFSVNWKFLVNWLFGESIFRWIHFSVNSHSVNSYATVTLYLLIAGLNTDPNEFPEPFEFKLERSLIENLTSNENFFRLTPFSSGLRNCIGEKFAKLQIKLLLAKLFRKFEIRSLTPRTDMKVKNGIITVPENGINVSFKLRN